MKNLKVILGASVLLFSSIVNALIIENGDWTTDTSTGLEWLDLNLTYGTSYSEIESNLLSGGIYGDSRRATTDELIEFLFHSGISINITASNIGEADEALSFIEMIGGGWTDSFGIVTANGLTIDNNGKIVFSLLHAYPDTADFNQGATQFIPSFIFVTPDFGPDANGGQWLVRSASVPEPSIIVLMFTSLLGLGLVRRRMRVH